MVRDPNPARINRALVLGFAILALGVLHTRAQIYHQPCGADSDCAAQNGVCFDGYGFSGGPRCACAAPLSFDPVWFRCAEPKGQSPSPNRTWLFSEQQNVTLFSNGPRPGITGQWQCDIERDYCVLEGGAALLLTTRGQTSVLLSNTSTYLSGSLVNWRCAGTTHAVVPAADLGWVSGFHGFADYCVECEDWCAMGVCSADLCVCQAGWTGPRCDQPLGRLPLWNQGLFSLVPYNAGRACVVHSDCGYLEKCYFSPRFNSSWCYCEESAYPAGASSCALQPSLVQVGTQWNGGFFNLTYLTSDYRSMWFSNATHLFATYSAVPFPSPPSSYFFLNTSNLDYYYVLAELPGPEGTPVGNCSGNGVAVTNTSCACFTHWVGPTCAVYDLVCRASECNGHGSCLQNLSCVCDTGWFASACNVSASACALSRCSGNGSCADQYQTCTCEPEFAGYACSDLFCENNGTWNASAGACVCPLTWSGTRCETRRCGPTAIVYPDHCVCSAPYTGDFCTLPCVHGGTYNFTADACECPPLTDGLLCENVYTPVPTPRSDTDEFALLIYLIGVIVFLLGIIYLVQLHINIQKQKLHKKRV
jgi:hypothetical protein